MARLPRISSEPVLTRGAQSSLSARDIADPFMAVAEGFGAVGTMLQQEDEEQASYEGTNAVYRDEAGQLKVKENPHGTFGRASNNYERAAMQALTARMEGDIRSKGAGFAEAAKGDVNAFTDQWKGFRSGLVKSVPKEARGALDAELDRVGQQYTLGISEQKRKRDLATFEGDLKAEAQLLDDEASALARGGGTSTPEYAERMSRIKSLYSDLAANPDFSVGEKEAEVAVKRIESRHVSEAIVGSVDRTLTEQGAPAARNVAKRILEDDSLSLSPAERRQYAGIANERINGWLAQQKVALEPVKDKAKKLTSLLDDGVGMESPDIDDVARELARGGATSDALDLIAARAKARNRLSFQQGTNEEQVDILRRAMEMGNGRLPAGMRNNNPGNIKFVGQGRDKGVVGPSVNTDQGDPQAVFESPEAGMREAVRLARSKYDGGKTTANQIIAGEGGWTPGNFDAAANIARGMGLEPDDDLNLKDPTQAAKFMRSLVKQEHGNASDAYSDAMITNAVNGSPSAPRGPDLPVVVGDAESRGRISQPDVDRVQPEVLSRFKQFQNAFGASVPIMSGYRDPARNARAGGAKQSQHMEGNALDLDVSGMSKEDRVRLIQQASKAGFTGIGVYGNSIHIDTGNRRAWGPDHHKESVPEWARGAIAEHMNGAAGPAEWVADPELVKDYRTEVTADAKSLWGDIKSGMEKGIKPDGREVDLLSRQLALINDGNFSREVNQFFDSDAGANLIASLPTDQATQIIDALKSDAVDGATVAQQDILASAQRAQEMKATALKVDPVGYAVDKRMIEPVPALDPAAGPDAMGSALVARQRAVDLLRARGDVGNVSALRPEDQRMLGQFIQTATPREQADLLGGMSRGLKPETYQATLEALYAKDDTKALATAGALYRDNPEAAEGIIRGRALLRENSDFAPKDTADNRQGLDAILPSTTFPSGMERVRGRVLEAARARYADLSNLAGDTTGELNDERMQQAINEVTGGTLEFNGVPTIAPQYGMSQDDFDAVMSNLSDGDLAGAMTAEGKPITAREVRKYGRLRSVADGSYLVEFGEGGTMPTYAMKLPDYGMHSDADRRGAFVLRLDQAPVPMRRAPAPAPMAPPVVAPQPAASPAPVPEVAPDANMGLREFMMQDDGAR